MSRFSSCWNKWIIVFFLKRFLLIQLFYINEMKILIQFKKVHGTNTFIFLKTFDKELQCCFSQCNPPPFFRGIPRTWREIPGLPMTCRILACRLAEWHGNKWKKYYLDGTPILNGNKWKLILKKGFSMIIN